jgi:hypothetical protein
MAASGELKTTLEEAFGGTSPAPKATINLR